MNKVENKLRVLHFPQIGGCRKAFTVDVKDEEEAYFAVTLMANQHSWLFNHNIIPDFSNAIIVEMWDDSLDDDRQPYGWCNYWNEEEQMEWDEFEETYLKK